MFRNNFYIRDTLALLELGTGQSGIVISSASELPWKLPIIHKFCNDSGRDSLLSKFDKGLEAR